MAVLRLRDRDAIVTKEGLVFRVFGYSHPSESYVCDVEYSPADIFKSKNPKALRNSGKDVFYKFYADEGWKFVQDRFPQYMVFHEMLQRKVVGVTHDDAIELRKPGEMLPKLLRRTSKDALVLAMQNVLDMVAGQGGVVLEDFGIFGSLLHGFHHPQFSDIDLVVYGRRNVRRLCETLEELYETDSSLLRSEFRAEQAVGGKKWLFEDLSPREFLWHQRRKLIYAVYDDKKSGRIIKTEFEPVKDWNEIVNEYDSKTRIQQKGWVKVQARVTGDAEAPFIPSIFSIEPQQVLEGPGEAVEVKRVVSYVEEFRMQVKKDELVDVAGNLEEVITSKNSFYQIALTYCPRYYKQVLKVTKQMPQANTI